MGEPEEKRALRKTSLRKEILGISGEGHQAVQPSDICPNQSGAPDHWVASLVSIFCTQKDEVGGRMSFLLQFICVTGITPDFVYIQL